MTNKIVFKSTDGYVFVELGEIIRFEADRNYTLLYTTLKLSHFKLTINVTEVLKIIPSNTHLFHCHRSHIVNLTHLVQYKEKNKILVTMSGEVPIAESKIRLFKEIWKVV